MSFIRSSMRFGRELPMTPEMVPDTTGDKRVTVDDSINEAGNKPLVCTSTGVLCEAVGRAG